MGGGERKARRSKESFDLKRWDVSAKKTATLKEDNTIKNRGNQYKGGNPFSFGRVGEQKEQNGVQN